MPAAARLNDHTAGHGGFPSVPIIEGSPNVFINGRPAARLGDAAQAHSHDGESHQGRIASGSAHVLINGRRAARVGDALSCGDSIAEGSHNVTIGDGGDGSAAIETVFFQVKKCLEKNNVLTEKEKTILCLPDIAEHLSETALIMKDKQAWKYLSSMMKKWIASGAGKEASSFLVDGEWLLSYGTSRDSFALLSSLMDSDNALKLLGKRVHGHNLALQNGRFDFTVSTGEEIGKAYSQTTICDPVNGLLSGDFGLYAAMGKFSFRGLAAGSFVRLGEDMYDITFDKAAGVAVDSFNFEEDEFLGSWSCEDRSFSLAQISSGVYLSNSDFREFSKRFGLGRDFPVFSHSVGIEMPGPVKFLYNARTEGIIRQ